MYMILQIYILKLPIISITKIMCKLDEEEIMIILYR